jgi:hypothetical protein
MSAIMLDHEQSHEKNRQQALPAKKITPNSPNEPLPKPTPKRDEWHERDRNLEDAATVTRLTVSRESCYCAPRNISGWQGCECAFFYRHLHRPALWVGSGFL